MITKITKKKTTSKLTHGITNEQQATNKQLTTNNNDNNINLFIYNKESDFVPFKEGDEISQWLKTKGINSVEEYKELDSSKQDELMEEWFSKN